MAGRVSGLRCAALVAVLLLACSDDDPALGPANAPAGPQCSDWPIDSTVWYADIDSIVYRVYYRSPTPQNDCSVEFGHIYFYDNGDLSRDHEIDLAHTSVLAQEYTQDCYVLIRTLLWADIGILPVDTMWAKFNMFYGHRQGGSICDEWINAYAFCHFVDSLVVP